MRILILVFSAATWLANAQDAVAFNATLYSSVVFTRTGEHTPYISSPDFQFLTSLGAQQLYAVGGAFRDRYMGQSSASAPLAINRIDGLADYFIDNSQIFVMSPQSAYLAASAQAFMQGLYPPITLTMGESATLDPTNVVANRSYVEYPLNGYQYPQINTYSSDDPTLIFLTGDSSCPNQASSAKTYFTTTEFQVTRNASAELYHKIGEAVLSDVLDDVYWDYENAYLIYEYVNYQVSHDTTVNNLLSNNTTYQGDYARLQQLASQQQWAFLGDKTGDNLIRTIAGQTFAAAVLGLFEDAITSNGTQETLNLLFGDFQPFMSFFSLASLPDLNSNFFGLPDFGSSMVFELYSQDTSTDTEFPDPSDLWVTFYFRNGSNTTEELQAFPLFSRGPSETAIKWTDFQSEMANIMTDTTSDWCNACSAETIFCNISSVGVNTGSTKASESGMSLQVAGVIGAAVTLGAVCILLILAMLVGGFRFQRVTRSKKSELGGFKGSAKLASDADLAVPKAGPIASGVIIPNTKGKERVGSWELEDKEGKKVLKEDEDTISVNPFADPVLPHERV